MLAPWKKSFDKPRQHVKKQRHHFADKAPYRQSYGFSSSHVQMCEWVHVEGWTLKDWLFWTVVLEKTWESPGSKRSILKEINQSDIFIWRTSAEAETPIFWPPDVKSRLIGKDPGTGKDWGQEEKEAAENEMVGWYHHIYGHEFEHTPGDGEGQGSLACCSP